MLARTSSQSAQSASGQGKTQQLSAPSSTDMDDDNDDTTVDTTTANDTTANDTTANDTTANDTTANDTTANDTTANDQNTTKSEIENGTDNDALPPTGPYAYAPPSLTLLQLRSHSASSSALPASLDLHVTRRGGYVVVYSASKLWLLQSAELPRLWVRTLKVQRKPVALDLTEDGRLLAVLSRPSQVDVYDLHGDDDGDSDGDGNRDRRRISKRRTLALVHEASTLVISPDARILIAANRYGIEVIAIGPGAPETARRTLSGPAGDALEFSDDGRTLLITACARKTDGSALFVLPVLPGLFDGPLTEHGEPLPQPPEDGWIGSVLFPEPARMARQATLLPDADTGALNELFAFHADDCSWGIYDMACHRFTHRKMALPDCPPHRRYARFESVHDAMPAVSPDADLAAVALRIQGTPNICIYEVPGWELKPSEKALMQEPIQPRFCIPIPNDDEAVVQEICVLRWLRVDANIQRLVAMGNSTEPSDENEVPGAPLASKGVLILLDFDKRWSADSPAPEPVRQGYDLDPMCPGELLPEGSIDFEREVELVRTRTIAQRQAQHRHNHLARRPSRTGSAPAHRARTTTTRPAQRPRLPSADSEELTPEEAQALFEAPYDNQQPRSHMSLARAATVAAVSPANRQHLRALPSQPLDYRRADGHRELPHESDADGWVPPPPAYTTTAAAAKSVSLSHPDVPPPIPRFQRAVHRPSSPSQPEMSATIDPAQLPPLGPYDHPHLSLSSTNISTSFDQGRERGPSPIHPSTFPSLQSQPPSSTSLRIRSSAARPPSPQMSHIAAPIVPFPSSHAVPRRPPLDQTRAVETSIDTRTPDFLTDQGRRGSAPLLSGGIPQHARPMTGSQNLSNTFSHAQFYPQLPPHPPSTSQSQSQFDTTHRNSYSRLHSTSYSNTTPTPPRLHALRSSPFSRSQPHLLSHAGNGAGDVDSLAGGKKGKGKEKKTGCLVM